MRALVMTKHGPPDEALAIQERPDPPVGPGQVRIRVRAAGLNFADVLARIGLYPDAPKPPTVMGYEAAGEIESVGPGGDGFQPGQRVAAGTRFNGFAELATADVSNVLPIPDSLSFEEAAAVPVVFGTAYAALVLLSAVRPGETVLVHAAAGGVGMAAVQIARDRGAEVIGTASAAKHDAVREQGAAHMIDYRNQDVGVEVNRLTGGEGVDVVLDALGAFRESYKLLRPGGRLVMYGASQLLTGDKRNVVKVLRAIATMPRFNAIKLMNDNRSVMGLNLLHWWDERGSLDELLGPLRELLDRGVIKPVVAATFPFDRAADAHRFIQERRNVGKVVLTP
jgi:NADPH:quinone reductase-like Zn-dependent oxidoreductase